MTSAALDLADMGAIGACQLAKAVLAPATADTGYTDGLTKRACEGLVRHDRQRTGSLASGPPKDGRAYTTAVCSLPAMADLGAGLSELETASA